mgnify:CR=1 FL=1
MSKKEYPAKLANGYYRVREVWEDEHPSWERTVCWRMQKPSVMKPRQPCVRQ